MKGAALLLLLTACVAEKVAPPVKTWELTAEQPEVALAPPVDLLELIKPAEASDLDPDFLQDQPPSPFHRLGHSVIRGLDGSWSKTYTLRGGHGDSIVTLLQSSVPGFPAAPGVSEPSDAAPDQVIRYVLHQNFYRDESETFGKRSQVWKDREGSVADVLVVTAPPETLLFIDELLFKVLADIPQIELEVRIVEVNLDDLVEYDAQVLLKNLVDPTLPFDPVSNPVEGKFGAGIPIKDGTALTGAGAGFNSFLTPPTLSGFLLSLQGVHDNLQVNALLSLLQSIGASEIISAPTVTVLNGHRALLTTGDKVPVFEASGVGTNVQITTRFEDTGVMVELVPFIVSEDVIRIDLSLDVSAVTGEVPFVLAGTVVTTPVISQRDAGTTVHVHSGQVFSVGGLRSTESIETVTKVPFLGDIPLLGWLFKSEFSRKKNTEIVFFITPRIRIPSETLVNPQQP